MNENEGTLDVSEINQTEINLLGLEPSDFLLRFHDEENNNEEVGRFYLEDGKLKFQGDVDKSAKLFIETVLGLYNLNNG